VRTFLSIILVFLALAWTILASLLAFMLGAPLWQQWLGEAAGPVGAIISLGLAISAGFWLVRLADWVGQAVSEVSSPPPPEPEVTAPQEWRRQTEAMVENKRWAFYRRTHQLDRLRELEEAARARAKEQAGKPAR